MALSTAHLSWSSFSRDGGSGSGVSVSAKLRCCRTQCDAWVRILTSMIRMRTLPLRLSLAVVVITVACVLVPQRGLPSDTVSAATHSAVERSGAHATPSAMARLSTLDSSVLWDPQSVLVADIDCDGKSDSAFVGRSSAHVAVGRIRASGAAPEVLAFGTGGHAQDEVSSSNAELTVESLDYDPREMVGKIDGFQRSKVCKGLNFDDGETDSMHMFWNRRSGHLDWWRL
jgi:hypothetical protein